MVFSLQRLRLAQTPPFTKPKPLECGKKPYATIQLSIRPNHPLKAHFRISNHLQTVFGRA
ncbi:hypothetical protein J6590_061107, partial [Homalodisca vitripennis]